MTLSKFTVWNHHHHPSLELFHLWNKLCTHEMITPHHPLFHSPWKYQSVFCLWIDYSRYLVLSGIMQYLSFCDWLISLSIMLSRFIHIVTCVKIPFLLKSESCSTAGIDHIVLIQSSGDGHLGCFRVLDNMNNVAGRWVHHALSS